jgi:hypothetical protein
MQDAQFPAGLAAISRALRWKPQTYRQVWLFAAVGIALPCLVMFSIFGVSNGWHQPWLAFAIEFPGGMLIIPGLGMSYDVYRRRRERPPYVNE